MPELLETGSKLTRVAFIFNPVSGTADPTARRSRLEALAHAAGLECPLAETDVERGALPLAERAVRDGMERVLVSGGDGSVAEAAAVLAGTPVVLGVIPGGTGNLLAINLGIPADPEAAVRLALHGQPCPTDVGRANGHVFLIMAGMGADARMIRDADRELKQRLGFLAYFVAALKNLRQSRTSYRITVDGRTFRRLAKTVLIANMGRITGGVQLVPEAAPATGRLEVAVLRARTVWDLLRVAVNALVGARSSRSLLEIHHGSHIVIETRRPQPVQVDGNDIGSTSRLEIVIEPGALQLVRPPHHETNPHKRLLSIAQTEAAWKCGSLVAGAAVAACAVGYLLWSQRKRQRAPRHPGR